MCTRVTTTPSVVESWNLREDLSHTDVDLINTTQGHLGAVCGHGYIDPIMYLINIKDSDIKDLKTELVVTLEKLRLTKVLLRNAQVLTVTER